MQTKNALTDHNLALSGGWHKIPKSVRCSLNGRVGLFRFCSEPNPAPFSMVLLAVNILPSELVIDLCAKSPTQTEALKRGLESFSGAYFDTLESVKSLEEVLKLQVLS